MKRLFFTASLAFCLFSISASASDRNLPDAVNSFYKTFQNAQNINWTEVDDMLRIGFTLDGKQKFAYYFNNELVVVATAIKAEELPARLKEQLSAYKGYTFSQVYELAKDGMKEYCAVLDSSSKHIVLKGKKAWKVYASERK